MALSVAVFVGPSKEWLPELIAKAKTFKLGAGTEAVDITPLSYKELRERVHGLVDSAEKEGARVLLDGRNYKNTTYPNGYFFAPTVIDNVTTIYKYI